jgi:imidazoleglycerol-phosphate dehydratase
MSEVRRKTRETNVLVRLQREAASGTADIDTTRPFLDHMLEALARYSGLDIKVEARGDLPHHIVEDVAITLGLALKAEIPETCGRYGSALVPMDDALVQVAVDAGGRSYYEGPLPDQLAEHFLRSLADQANLTVHCQVLRGEDEHHVVEAVFKALGLCLRQALAPGDAVFSTKGAAEIDWTEDRPC